MKIRRSYSAIKHKKVEKFHSTGGDMMKQTIPSNTETQKMRGSGIDRKSLVPVH